MESQTYTLFEEVEALRAIADHGSANAAAKEGPVGRLKLLRQVKSLEARLTERFGQPVSLLEPGRRGRQQTTALGRTVLELWQPALEAKHRIEGVLDVPQVRVLPQHLFPRLLDRASRGEVRLDIAPENDRSKQRFAEVLDDVALGLPLIAVGLDMYARAELTYRRLYSTPYWVLYDPAKHGVHQHWPLQSLVKERLLMAPRGARSRDNLERWCARQRLAPRIDLESYSPMALVKAAFRDPDRSRLVVLPADIALRFAKDEIFGHAISKQLTWAPLMLPEQRVASHLVVAYGAKDSELVEGQLDELERDVQHARTQRADGTSRETPSGPMDAYMPPEAPR